MIGVFLLLVLFTVIAFHAAKIQLRIESRHRAQLEALSKSRQGYLNNPVVSPHIGTPLRRRLEGAIEELGRAGGEKTPYARKREQDIVARRHGLFPEALVEYERNCKAVDVYSGNTAAIAPAALENKVAALERRVSFAREIRERETQRSLDKLREQIDTLRSKGVVGLGANRIVDNAIQPLPIADNAIQPQRLSPLPPSGSCMSPIKRDRDRAKEHLRKVYIAEYLRCTGYGLSDYEARRRADARVAYELKRWDGC